MAMTTDRAISTLNNLIETCRDGQNGFRTAADAVRDSELKTLFMMYSRQRAQFVAELQAEVRRLGGNPEDRGSMAAALHRGWLNMKSAVTGGNDRAIIAEAERGEDSAVENYEEARQAGLPTDVQSIVERQFTQIKSAHDRVRALENQTAA